MTSSCIYDLVFCALNQPLTPAVHESLCLALHVNAHQLEYHMNLEYIMCLIIMSLSFESTTLTSYPQ